jgi:DNA-binding response OmpR family regulator
LEQIGIYLDFLSDMSKILVVNNDLDTMSLIKDLLEKHDHNFEVKFTGTREKVPGIIKDFNPDLVIIDVLQKDALDILKTSAPDIPIILMTGETLRDRNVELEVNDVIEKPFVFDLLESMIRKHIRANPTFPAE